MRTIICALAFGLLAATSASAIDLTTTGSPEARYLVNLGRAFGDTSWTGSRFPNGLYDYVSAGGNAAPWFRMNDGITDDPNQAPNTFRGQNPDFFGYLFKWPVQSLAQIDFYNRTFVDGGTFAAQPEVQYLDAVDGNWVTIADVTWDPPYNPDYGAGGEIRPYLITINQSPAAPIWGIRLFGDAAEGVNDDLWNPPEEGGTGFIALTELVVHGEFEINGIDLNDNLALGTLPIANNWHPADDTDPARLTDGDPLTQVNTYGVISDEDYLGVEFAQAQNGVGGVGVIMKWYGDGGLVDDGCFDTLRIEYTTDGTTWTDVPGLNKGRYTDDWMEITFRPWGPETGFLFTFDHIDGVLGLRLVGNGYGHPLPPDIDGFIGAFEFEVFGVPRLFVDYDGDGDVDLNDFHLFDPCTSGPTIPHDPGCEDKDLDGDGDVDGEDFAIFQRCITGPDIPMDPNCAL